MEIDAKTSGLIKQIYGYVPAELAAGIAALDPDTVPVPTTRMPWTERDVVLITYADQIRADGPTPLHALRDFLLQHGLDRLIRCIHLLPFFPFTSDDGFSVVDYLAVDSKLGTWDDIARLKGSFDLQFDLVLNHVSQEHEWFKGYLAGVPEYADFFIDQDPTADLSAVVRPRSLPLLTKFNSAAGIKNIWTTFSADQVDLNVANPRVLLRILETLVEYARRGARIIRLDAVAFLWKEPGTTCIHLPQTHAAVQLMRRVLDRVAPGTLILTETNVPHAENISYFGDGTNEAHMVYQFSLPPLLLDAIHSGDTSVLRDWLSTLQPPTDQTTFFNFTASHDGIGVRPLEGIVPAERLEELVGVVRRHGGRVSMRSRPDGSESPYELNITYVDAVADRRETQPAEHARRFLATQAIMMSVQGIPAIYFHSLVGSPNDDAGVESSGQNRRINRHKYDRSELERQLADPHSLQRRIFDGIRRLLEIRIHQPAFHPAASLQLIDLPGDGLLGFKRISTAGEEIVVLANLSDRPRWIDQSCIAWDSRYDLIAQQRIWNSQPVPMRPFQIRWIVRD